MAYHFTIISDLQELPTEWEAVVSCNNVLISKNCFEVLQRSKPENMECYAICFYKNEKLIGGALFQYLDFQKHSTFQKNEIWCDVRNFLAKKYSKDVLIIGNNMLTGEHGGHFDFNEISPEEANNLIEKAVLEFQKKIKKTSLIIYKDYQKPALENFDKDKFQNYFRFSVQPNMVLDINKNWIVYEDYLASFSKKYRDRAKSARRKFDGLEMRELQLKNLQELEKEMHILYQNVAENAPFNTFFLTENHFSSAKEILGSNFRIFGYFSGNQLVGFYSFILNHHKMDTYFLGYDKDLQKPKQLYLNMLLDMVKFGIENKLDGIVFGRTALEIKSTVGAEPIEIFGLIKHNNFFINRMMPKIFPYIEPKVEWIQRKPFK